MSKEVLTELRHKKEVYKRWKQGQVTQEEYIVLLSSLAEMGLGKQKPAWS